MNDFVAVHTQTGHPHTDRDGTTYIMGTQFGRETNYVFYKIPKNGTMKDLTVVGKSAGQIHSQIYPEITNFGTLLAFC